MITTFEQLPAALTGTGGNQQTSFAAPEKSGNSRSFNEILSRQQDKPVGSHPPKSPLKQTTETATNGNDNGHANGKTLQSGGKELPAQAKADKTALDNKQTSDQGTVKETEHKKGPVTTESDSGNELTTGENIIQQTIRENPELQLHASGTADSTAIGDTVINAKAKDAQAGDIPPSEILSINDPVSQTGQSPIKGTTVITSLESDNQPLPIISQSKEPDTITTPTDKVADIKNRIGFIPQSSGDFFRQLSQSSEVLQSSEFPVAFDAQRNSHNTRMQFPLSSEAQQLGQLQSQLEAQIKTQLHTQPQVQLQGKDQPNTSMLLNASLMDFNVAQQSQLNLHSFDQQMAERLLKLDGQGQSNNTGLTQVVQLSSVTPATSTLVLSDATATVKNLPATHITVPVSDQHWGGELAAQVKMMVTHTMEKATIQLSPPDMGRLEIKIATEGDQAKVHFLVHNSTARDAIEQAMPRLRELLEQGGLQLAHSQVSDHSQSWQNESQMRHQASSQPDSDALTASKVNDDSSATHILDIAIKNNSTIDFYI